MGRFFNGSTDVVEATGTATITKGTIVQKLITRSGTLSHMVFDPALNVLPAFIQGEIVTLVNQSGSSETVKMNGANDYRFRGYGSDLVLADGKLVTVQLLLDSDGKYTWHVVATDGTGPL